MNNYFKEKVQKLKSRTSPDLAKSLAYTQKYVQNHGIRQKDQELSFQNVDWSCVQRHIKTLKNTNAMGVNIIPTLVLKKFMNVLTPAIVHIVNLCLTQSVYPEVWKIGILDH